MNKEKFIYVLLLTAIFNAVLRVSQESSWTLFRVLIPFVILFLNAFNKKVFGLFTKYSLILIVIAVLQNFILKTWLYPHIHSISFSHLFSFCIHYISIFLVAALVYCLVLLYKGRFFIEIINHLSNIVKIILFVYVFYLFTGQQPADFRLFGNINDFGCVLNGSILIILFDSKTRRKYLYLALILVLLFYNDSKLSLFGGILEIGLYTIYDFSNRFIYAKKLFLYAFIGMGVLLILLFFTSSISINGYSVRDLFLIPYTQISEGIYFPQSSESYTYRTNSIIGITEIFKTTKGVGIGPGNTSLILKVLMPDPDGSLGEESVSSHIWWYEVMADIGWLIIIPALFMYINQLKNFIRLKSTREELFSQIYIITFPLWSMSSSGLYTEFFTIILLSLSIFIYRKHSVKTIIAK